MKNVIKDKFFNASRITHYALRNKNGFALIAALLAILIITAVGMLVFTVTTRDIMVSARVTGEKKAFSAAEAGIHQAIQNFAVGGTASNVQVDPATDPDTRYSYTIGASSSGCTPPPAGFDIEKWSEDMYAANVTGTNARYGSTVQVDVGIGLFKSGTCEKTTD
jgi:Tfp pilus assembly protein PilX